MGSWDLPVVLSYKIKLLRVAVEEQNSIVVFKKMFKSKNVLQWLHSKNAHLFFNLFPFKN